MPDNLSTRSVTIHRTFAAPPQAVFGAFMDPAQVTQWMKCDGEVILSVEDWDTRPQGRFRTVMSVPGQWEAETVGTFTDIEPNQVFAYISDPSAAMNMPAMTVRAEFEPVDSVTRLTITHAGIPTEEVRTTIRGGWTTSLSLLEQHLMQMSK